MARRVRARRRELGLTAKQLAERSGLSPRFVSELESGRGNISIGRLASVAQALERPLQDLVAEDRNPRGIPVALLGLRGAGKTTLGRALARRMGARFVEVDDAIEERAGLAIEEIFSLHGEGFYRRLEAECLAALLNTGDPAVVALSGGVVHNAPAFDLARARCRTVWLRAEPEEHMARVLAQGDRRPVAGREDAMAELRALLAGREPLYRQADLVIETSGCGVEASVEALEAALREP